MNAPPISRWVVALADDLAAADFDSAGQLTDGALERRMLQLRQAYVEQCPTLSKALDDGSLRMVSVLAHRSNARFDPDSGILGAATVTEIRPSSIDLAVRIRSLGDDASAYVDAIFALRLQDAAGRATPVPDWLRRELIAAEATAREYC